MHAAYLVAVNHPLSGMAIEWLSFPKGIGEVRDGVSNRALYPVEREALRGSLLCGVLPVAKAGGYLLAGA